MMNETWKNWVGQVVNAKFPLRKYIGGSDHSIVFLTESDSRPAAIKLIRSDSDRAEAKLSVWTAAKVLSHPNLLTIMDAGRCRIDGVPMIYIVMEFADDNLSELPPQTHLTPEDALQALPPVLNALTYLHNNDFIHGHIKPSNIMAIGDQVKLSSDFFWMSSKLSGGNNVALQPSQYDPPESSKGIISPAADMWALGVSLKEVSPLLAKASENDSVLGDADSASSFKILNHLLDPDPARRWTAAKIVTQLELAGKAPSTFSASQTSSGALRPKSPAKKVAIVAAVLMVGAFVGVKLLPKRNQVQPNSAPVAANTTESAPKPTQPLETNPYPVSPVPTEPAKNERGHSSIHRGAVVHQVVPTVPRSARNTVHGHLPVTVRANVDANGNVTSATLDAPAASQYFARLSSEAAQQWKFSPAQANGKAVATVWILRFTYSRRGTQVHATPVTP